MKDYRTTDIYMAAFILTMDGVLDKIEGEPGNPKRVFFILNHQDPDNVVKQFQKQEKMEIIPSRLFQNLKHLKSVLHEYHADQ